MKRKLLLVLFSIFISSSFYSFDLGKNNLRKGYVQNSNDVVVIFPNPARDYVIVKTKNSFSKIKSLTFYSIVGTQVLETQLNSNYGEVRVDRLKAGKYLVKYTLSDGKQGVVQLIKN